MKNQNLKIFSFFSGSGFLDLGFEMNGFDIKFVNEFNPSFLNAYQYSRERLGIEKPEYGYYNGDVNIFLNEQSKILKDLIQDARKDGNLIGFIGGPPCPDFSVAGKNQGCNGDNGKLSLSYINLIITMKPDFFLFENVKGLWKTSRHRAFFDELKNMLHLADYKTTERLTNALEYAAPQDRDRILMFGIQNQYVLNKTLKEFPWEKYQFYNLSKIKSLPWPITNHFNKDSKIDCPDGIPKELTVQYWFDKNNVEHHPNSNDYFTPRGGLAKMQTIMEGDVSKKSYKRLHRWRFSPTVAYGNNEVHLHPYKERRISVSEAMSLQSLPKNFELPENMTLTDKFKTIGNGVPYLLSSGIAKTISDFLSDI